MSIKLTTDIFIKRAILVHGNKYDYSLTSYLSFHEPLKIICKIHGVFLQTPRDHFDGCGCGKCWNENKTSAWLDKQFNDFLYKASLVHHNKYDYSLAKFRRNKELVKIICPQHGIFKQTPNSHIQGRGCPECKKIHLHNCFKSNTDYFIEKAKIIHGTIYNYEDVNYINNKTKVIIKCIKHGAFLQNPTRHLSGDGCPCCKLSHGEEFILNILIERGILFEKEKMFDDCRMKRKMRFDFYLPSLNTIIEYHGRQHFYPVGRWGGLMGLMDRKRNDEYKQQWAETKRMRYVIFKYSDGKKSIGRRLIKILK